MKITTYEKASTKAKGQTLIRKQLSNQQSNLDWRSSQFGSILEWFGGPGAVAGWPKAIGYIHTYVYIYI